LVNLKTKNAGDSYSKKAVKKTALRFLGSRTFHTAWVESGQSSVVHISAHRYKMACDEDKERFEEKLKRIARAKPKTGKKD